jgi:hypothetical protein
MKIKVDLFVMKDSQVASAWIRQVGDNPPNITTTWEGYDSYTFVVNVPHKTDFPEIRAISEVQQ